MKGMTIVEGRKTCRHQAYKNTYNTQTKPITLKLNNSICIFMIAKYVYNVCIYTDDS